MVWNWKEQFVTLLISVLFVDVGVKQDGLVHISKLSKQYVKHPLDVVSVGQIVKVWVDDIDTKKRSRCIIYVAD